MATATMEPKTAVITAISIAIAFIFSCSSDSNEENPPSSSSGVSNGNSSSSFEESKTAKVGEQIWLAENLNYDIPNSKCYGEGGKVFAYGVYDSNGNQSYTTLTSDEIQSYCKKYGRLYDWATAMALPSSCNYVSCERQINNPHRGICPEGYHIPSYEEWVVLRRYAGESAKLKSTSDWIDPYDGSDLSGTDEYGFSALPGGRGWPDGSFDAAGNYGQWWGVTEGEGELYGDDILVPYMGYYGDIDDQFITFFSKKQFFSVRCIQD